MTRAEFEALTATYYDCDPESLTHESVEEAVEAWIDRLCELESAGRGPADE